MKKIIMAAGIAASMLFATSAFAEIPNTIEAEYKPATGYITLTGDGVTEKATTTYLVISRGETEPTGAFTGTIDDTMIKQINQVDGTSTVATIYVGTGLADGFYEVRVGGDGSVVYDTFEVKNVKEPDLSTQEGAKEYFKDCKIALGNVDGSEYTNVADVSALAAYIANLTFSSKEVVQASDVDDSGLVNVADVTVLAAKIADPESDIATGTVKVNNKTTYVTDYSDFTINE